MSLSTAIFLILLIIAIVFFMMPAKPVPPIPTDTVEARAFWNQVLGHRPEWLICVETDEKGTGTAYRLFFKCTTPGRGTHFISTTYSPADHHHVLLREDITIMDELVRQRNRGAFEDGNCRIYDPATHIAAGRAVFARSHAY